MDRAARSSKARQPMSATTPTPDSVEELVAHVREEAAEAPTHYAAEVPVAPASGKLRIPVRVREDHLTPETDGSKCVVQASFDALKVAIPSDRDTVMLRLPLAETRFGQSYARAISDWRVNISRWADAVEVSEEGTVAADVCVLPDGESVAAYLR